jgi:hypothetical protein
MKFWRSSRFDRAIEVWQRFSRYAVLALTWGFVVLFLTAIINILWIVGRSGGALPIIVLGAVIFAFALLAYYPSRHSVNFAKWKGRRDLKRALKLQALREVDYATAVKSPPGLAEFLLVLLGPRNELGVSMVGCFAEQFALDCHAFGYERACKLYWAETLRSIMPAICTRIRRWGVFAIILEYGRRILGL